MHAATSGRINYVKTLLDRNADTNFQDENGKTAADLAIKSGNHQIAYLLDAFQSKSWDEIVSTEKSLKMMLNELHNGKALDGLLNTHEFGHLKNRMINDSLTNSVTWFRASENVRIGFDDDFHIRWMINDREIDDLW